MSASELLSVYRRYLQCLNDRRWDDLAVFVADDVVHNAIPLGLNGYRTMLEADTKAIPDLRFVPEILLADGDVVSCRLSFRCTPQETFLGVDATEATIVFAEHVFYRFENARIGEVWSLIDKDAVREQLTSRPPG